MKDVYIFDIDGTLANNQHRLHHIEKEPKDWDAFFEECSKDEPIKPIIDLAITLSQLNIICITGRPERVREKTEKWLKAHLGFSPIVFMRKDGDHRPDYIIKKELMIHISYFNFKPLIIFDDRTSVVEMWRKEGYTCAQVANGDF